METVFVTGGSGFVGSAVIDELLARGLPVRAMVNHSRIDQPGVETVRGSLFDQASLANAMAGCSAVIHLVGIIREKGDQTFDRIHVQGTRGVVEATERAGVKRYLQMSALGSRAEAESEYHRTKFAAEQIVRQSSLDWTILRPSLIHGKGGEFMQMEAAWARRQSMPYLFMPYFGSGVLGLGGAGLLQPVYVGDVAKAFAEALARPGTIRQSYDLGGADRLTWPQLHQLSAEAIVGSRRAIVPIPAWYARLLTRVVPASLLPFNRAQVAMSQEDNIADLTAFTRDFGLSLQPFEPTLRSYADQL